MYRTSEQMYPIIEQYEAGELSKKEFCEDHNISVHVFQYWLRKYREAKMDTEDNFSTLEITKSADAGMINIHLPNGTRIAIPMN